VRYIIKKCSGGSKLNSRNENPPLTPTAASRRWKSFRGKAEVIAQLEADQFGLCSYSEIRPDIFGLGVHIEHIEPRNKNPSRTFDYSNLALNALSSSDLSNISPLDSFSGHHKGGNYDSALFISCFDARCSEFFVYLSDGRVEPASGLSQLDYDRAVYTRDLLNLNSPYLVNQRKNWLDELDFEIDKNINNIDALEILAYLYLIPSRNLLDPFFSANRKRFSNLAEKVLNDNSHEF